MVEISIVNGVVNQLIFGWPKKCQALRRKNLGLLTINHYCFFVLVYIYIYWDDKWFINPPITAGQKKYLVFYIWNCLLGFIGVYWTELGMII